MNKPQIILAGTRNEINNINIDLQNKCGSSYKLELLQYRFRDTSAAVYDDTSNEYDIILCLYHGPTCVSSVTGRYNPTMNSMELLSKTAEQYEGLKYNLYLRSIFIYLMCFVRPTIQTIFSYATNPISTYAMYKHFHATNADLQEYVSAHHLTPDTFTVTDAINFHQYYVEKYKQTPESARKELAEMLEDCSENYGTQCSVEDLGWETEEDAIEFIINTMNSQAIKLQLNLKTPGVKEFLLHKLLNTQIKCAKTPLPTKTFNIQSNAGGYRKKNCRKSKRSKNLRRKSSRLRKTRRL